MKKSALVLIAFLSSIMYSQVGINTNAPTQTLDVNGNGRFRLVPDIQSNAAFYRLGVNGDGVLAKETSISSYSTYLGFSPMAATHRQRIPLTLENGYFTRITGTSVGKCNGVMVDFTIYFIGKSYLGATLQAREIATTTTTTITNTNTNTNNVVTLPSSKSIFGTPLEVLAKDGSSSCGANLGHKLRYNNGQITVIFSDTPPYYPNAGLFIIYSINKVKQTN